MKKIRALEKVNNFLTSKGIKKTAFVIGCILLALLLIACIILSVFFIMKATGKHSMLKRRNGDETETRLVDDYDFDPFVEHYGGKTYRYNNDLTNFLVIGVDKEDGFGATEGIAGSGGQADVLILAVLDEKKKSLSLISIDRNTLCSVETFDSNGNSIGFSEKQLTYAYAYGDGLHESCELTSRAVSDLMYGVPVHAYYSLLIEAVRDLNDAVGGVTVTIPVDMTPENEALVKGETIKLNGKQAEAFLRARMLLEDPSNSARLSRQKMYIMSFIDAAIDAVKKDISLPLDLYELISSNSCTDLSADEIVYLATLAKDLKINYYSIKGTTDSSGSFDAFIPDYDSLYELVLDIFYICEDQT